MVQGYDRTMMAPTDRIVTLQFQAWNHPHSWTRAKLKHNDPEPNSHITCLTR